MKRIFTLLFFTLVVLGLNAQVRYIDEIFTDVAVESDIVYATNITVITGAPAPSDILLDIYTPVGDTETNRPLIKVFHTGNFLPQLVNGQINGNKTDPYVVDMIERLVRRGYVVASVTYRLGWNPISPDQDVRTNTLINAAYRGVQDSHTATRFFRKSIEEGNPYGLSGQIINWGVGTGGYITLGAGSINEYNDVVLPKFIGADQLPMVLEQVSGDPFGEVTAPINISNHAGYSNDIDLTVNMGGAIGDLSWLDADDAPIVSIAVPTDPFAPYNTDFLIVPTTGDLVVEVSGSYDLQERAAELGINGSFAIGTLFTDDQSASANSNNDGLEGLYPLVRPLWDLDGDPSTPPIAESSPWDWWDVAFWSTQAPPPCDGIPIEMCNWDLISRANNPDASFEKGTTYMDSIIGYYAPRALVTLELPGFEAYLESSTEDLDPSIVSITPNPASTSINISAKGENINSISIFAMDGQLLKMKSNVNSESITIQRNNLPTGIYFVKAFFDKGVATQKVVFE